MLLVWTKTSETKTISSLSPVLKNYENLPVMVTGIFSLVEGATILLALGSEALKALQDQKLVHKNRTITSLRTNPVYFNGVPILISYNPEIGDINYGYYVDLLTDVGLAVRYHQTGSFEPQLGTYRWVENFSDMVAKIKARYEATNEPVDVMTDTETLGLDPYRQPSVDHPGAYIITIQCTDELTFADAVAFHSRKQEEAILADPVFRESIDFLLNSPMVKHKGANFKYDLNWLWVRGKFECTNFTFDTTMVGSLLDENRSNALDVHVKIYASRGSGYSDEFDRVVDKNRMDLALANAPDKFLNYACGDVDFGLEVAGAQKQALLKDPQLTAFYVNILHPASRAFEKIERGGVLVDMNAFKELKSDLEAEQIRLINQASKIMGGRIVFKHMDVHRFGGINLTKASMLIDFMFTPMGLNLKPKMFTEKESKPSTSMEHLEMFADDPKAKDFIELLGEYSSVTKTYNTFVLGFLEDLRSDGRFHPTYFLFVGDREEDEGGARTGRLSARHPPFQTIPKFTKWAKRIRRCYTAPPGYVITERDYSQGELRVIACIANCLAMIQVYKENKDLHVKTAAFASKMLYEELVALAITNPDLYEAIRQKGKAGNFGLVFGMMPPGFVNYARINYKVEFTLSEATDFRNEYFKEYFELLIYHDTFKKLAHKFKMVRTPLGRIRHLPLIDSPNREFVAKEERRAINSPVQGTLTDMMLWSIAIEDLMGLSGVAPGFGVVHDSVLNYNPEDKVDVILPKQLEVMQNLPFEKVGWSPQLQFVADAKMGLTMGDLVKFKK